MHTIPDLEAAARRRLPRRVYDFIAGGAGGEQSARRNVQAFARMGARPRVLGDVGLRTLETRLLGRDYAAPFGIAPMGMCDMAWPGTDRGIALAARAGGVPHCLSMAASTPLARVHGWAGESLWYQMYPCGEESLRERQVCEAERLGIETLLLTLDVPVPGLRRRDVRNGFSAPMRWSASACLDFAAHGRWSLATLAGGAPRLRNVESMMEPGQGAAAPASVMAIFAQAIPRRRMILWLRERWKGNLVVKGILHPEDAIEAKAAGADAIVVSNHGGRQLGMAISSLEALAPVRRAVGADFPLMLDGGIRSGEDIAAALALGADFVLAGRPFLFASAALGPDRGPAGVIALLKAELDNALAQLGYASPAMLRQVAMIDAAAFTPPFPGSNDRAPASTPGRRD